MNPREVRLLEILIKQERVLVKDLREMIGAQNPAHVKFSLIQKGVTIHTDYISMKDRDGNDCRPGYYYMDLQDKEKARAILKKVKGEAATAPKTKVILKSHTSKFIQQYDNKKRGI